MKYYPIDEDLARRAKEMNSFFDYVPGSATAEYRRCVDEAARIAEAQKQRVDPIHHEKIDRLLDAYARKLADILCQEMPIFVPHRSMRSFSTFDRRERPARTSSRWPLPALRPVCWTTPPFRLLPPY